MTELHKQSGSTQSGLAILIILAVFAGCAFGSAFFVARNKALISSLIREITELTKTETPASEKTVAPKTGREMPFSKKPLILTAQLADPKVIFPDADFSLASKFAETDFCQSLSQVLPELKLAWKDSTFISDATECAGVLNATPDFDGEPHNSLFVQVRRNATGATSVVRLKLVLLPDIDEPHFRSAFEHAATAVMDALFPDDSDLLHKLTALTPFDERRQGIDVKLFEEQLFKGSYNLLIESKCDSVHCPTASRYYRLNLPPRAEIDTAQQE